MKVRFIIAGVLFLSFLAKETLTRETCAGGKVYLSCGSACTSALTCETYEDRQDIVCATVCIEGCFCPEGTVDHNGVCISPLECPMYQSVCNGVRCPQYTTCQSNDVTGDSGCYPDCDVLNGGCREDQICEVVMSDGRNGNGNAGGFTADPENYYINCLNVPYVLCDESFCKADSYHCVQQNRTGQNACINSCLSNNGGCREDQVCITEIPRDDMTTSLRCLDADDLSSDCPAGQVINNCGDHCQETCEQRVSGELFACLEICGPPACTCPPGLLLFRDRCVDPRLCYVLLNNPPAIRPLPLVDENQYLYSFFSPGSSMEDFSERQFLEAIRNVLSSQGFSEITVDFHGLYEDDGLQIVVMLSGEGVNVMTSAQFADILAANSDQLPLSVDQVSLVDADRVDADRVDADRVEGGGDFWTAGRIAGLAVGVIVSALLIVSVSIALVLFVACFNSNKTGKTAAGPRKVKVDADNLMAAEELQEKEKLELEN